MSMDITEQLKAWGAAHAQARAAERAARKAGNTGHPGEMHSEARVLRERADRLHREIYRSLDRRGRDSAE
jgi:hypothetical protein